MNRHNGINHPILGFYKYELRKHFHDPIERKATLDVSVIHHRAVSFSTSFAFAIAYVFLNRKIVRESQALKTDYTKFSIETAH
jgi:hypothetical protein